MLDFSGPYSPRQKDGKDQIMVVVCRLTKMAHFIPCKTTQTAEELADLYVDNIVRLHGIPEQVRGDRDKLFTSKFWGRVWKRLGTSLAMIKPL